MKKKFFILIATLFIGSSLSAQFARIGLKAGINYNNFEFDDVNYILINSKNYSLSQDENFNSFHVGLMTRFKIFMTFIQPELYFNTSGGNVLIEETRGGVTTEYLKKITYNKIDLPFLAGTKLLFLRVYAGPVASVVLSTNSEISDIIPERETLAKNATIGFQAGTGFDLFKTLTFDIRFESGATRLGDKIIVGNQDYNFDSRSRKFMLSFGFFF